MEHQILSQDMISQPELWRCAFAIYSDRIEVALFPPVNTERLIHRTILLNPDASSHDKAVQEAVYANPLLLSDFARMDVLIDTPDFCIVPTSTARAVDTAAILTTASIDITGKSTEVCHAADRISIAFAMDAHLAGFIRRTFFNVHLSHIISPLIANPPVADALFVERTSGEVLITATAEGKLIYGNIFPCDNPADATYYITAVSRNLPVTNLPVLLAGKTEDTGKINEYLSRYVTTPRNHTISPSLATLGEDALTLPQPLAALLSCE